MISPSRARLRPPRTVQVAAAVTAIRLRGETALVALDAVVGMVAHPGMVEADMDQVSAKLRALN